MLTTSAETDTSSVSEAPPLTEIHIPPPPQFENSLADEEDDDDDLDELSEMGALDSITSTVPQISFSVGNQDKSSSGNNNFQHTTHRQTSSVPSSLVAPKSVPVSRAVDEKSDASKEDSSSISDRDDCDDEFNLK